VYALSNIRDNISHILHCYVTVSMPAESSCTGVGRRGLFRGEMSHKSHTCQGTIVVRLVNWWSCHTIRSGDVDRKVSKISHIHFVSILLIDYLSFRSREVVISVDMMAFQA
jgi:hypothetical protein